MMGNRGAHAKHSTVPTGTKGGEKRTNNSLEGFQRRIEFTSFETTVTHHFTGRIILVMNSAIYFCWKR
jgi:hypothetical protein